LNTLHVENPFLGAPNPVEEESLRRSGPLKEDSRDNNLIDYA
jgi:hypothetical protein